MLHKQEEHPLIENVFQLHQRAYLPSDTELSLASPGVGMENTLPTLLEPRNNLGQPKPGLEPKRNLLSRSRLQLEE